MRLPVISLAVLLPAAAFAGPPEAETCAAKLTPDGQKIYAVTAPRVAPGVDLREVMTAEVRKLVMSGEMSRDTAKKNAPAAGSCLQHLNQ
ncbi:hypothetical protein [Roseibium aquae]|nr:hypothetical protein [Roseibium aquae]